MSSYNHSLGTTSYTTVNSLYLYFTRELERSQAHLYDSKQLYIRGGFEWMSVDFVSPYQSMYIKMGKVSTLRSFVTPKLDVWVIK